jgi:hypothetical protein
MTLPAALALAFLALLVGAALGHLTARRRRAGAQDNAAQQAAEERIAASESGLSRLRHDVRGALSPAMLSADRLTMSKDPAVVRSGEIIVSAIERVSALLDATRRPNPADIAAPRPPDLNGGSDQGRRA